MLYERPAHLATDDVIADTVVDLINTLIEREGTNVSNVVLTSQHLHLLRRSILMQQLRS